ncbi:MAG: Na+/H+ antiporter subunit E [Devosia nanyangense]|uniref:Na+/H+ antiporter subunit E n=1 Tax=Devosia nanyangense TaxID=1228055 RepID=A0A933L578_9HYPH|nr:Na+/H+ antiporter subunit E [Devosia nanyangense]
MILKWLSLFAFFLKELVVSTLKVAWLVVQPRPRLRPGIVAFPLTVTTDAQITLLANMITLTPGTLSLDVSDDRKTLYIHAIDIESREALIGSIAAGFETKVLEVLR